MTLGVGKMKAEQRMKWWNLTKEECGVVFREELRQGGQGMNAQLLYS